MCKQASKEVLSCSEFAKLNLPQEQSHPKNMCGIAGIISKNTDLDDTRVQRMLDAIRHRGPDDQGLWRCSSKKAVLGHCRLSILDLSSSGHQPIISSDGNTILVFNGEIYNYRELKEKHFPNDVNFRSTGDSELLFRMWERFGEDCLSELRGMFAFAVWDDRAETLTLARDPCGIKPLYYSQIEGELIFASELKAFKALNPKWPVDYESMGLFLKWGSIPSPKTAYQGIHALPSGSLLRYRNGRLQAPETFWNYTDVLLEASRKSPSILSRQDAVAWVRETTLESVRAHLVSDEPVGAFLSGGIDSSAIVSLMRAAGQNDIGTFCMGFQDEDLNESHHAQVVADQFETQHVCRVLTKDAFLDSLDGFFTSLDQPTLDGLNTYTVSQLAHEQGYKVITSGIGGDELFGGYRRDFIDLPKLHRRLNLAGAPGRSMLRKGIQAGLRTGVLPAHWARVDAYLKGKPDLNRCLDMGRGIYSSSEVEQVFSDASSGAQAAGHCADQYLPELPASLNARDSVSRFLLSRYLGAQLLRDSDNFSMAFSLELRTPLVDSVLYEQLAQIRNQEWYLQGEIGKSLLVDAIGDLPHSITHRKKCGFTPPFGTWLQSNSFELQSGLLSEDYFQSVVTQYKAGRIPWSRVWMLIVLDRFLKG